MTTVLITRPLSEARQLAELLDNIGIGSIVMPLYDFSGRAPDTK
jgi:uroporphyrinogen-III synthase